MEVFYARGHCKARNLYPRFLQNAITSIAYSRPHPDFLFVVSSTTVSFNREKILPARMSHFRPSVYIHLKLHPWWEKHHICTCLDITRKQDVGGEGAVHSALYYSLAVSSNSQEMAERWCGGG